MSAPSPIDLSLDIEHAMNRVLAAERAALAAVEECREQARRIVDEARRDSRRILDRAEARATRVHSLTDRVVAARLAEIRAQATTLADQPLVADEDLARVRAVVPLLVAELIGQEA